jgi:hypothetical protein
MNQPTSKLITVCFAVLLVIFPSQGMVQAQGLRVLVETSKDGGLWWFPRGRSFNPNEYHQGKVLADFMRGMGWKVTELPRGDIITFENLVSSIW